MAIRSQVLADIALLRHSLRQRGSPHLPLLQLQPWRPLRDTVLDVVVIAAAIWLGLTKPWSLPLALVILGNRQRALGNILHDASHRNLNRDRRVNDLMTIAVLAPLLFLDLHRYREMHFRHHLDLGGIGADPDLIPIPPVKAKSWVHALALNVLSWRALGGSLFGHLVDSGVPWRRRAYIIVWWMLLCALLGLAARPLAIAVAMVVWLVARGTSFHVITTYREMCDHHGLTPGGVFAFARDLVAPGPWAWLIHPRNNAYHLTHHLLPAVPYYRLPDAQRLFATLEPYRDRGRVCHAYFCGESPVVSEWQRSA